MHSILSHEALDRKNVWNIRYDGSAGIKNLIKKKNKCCIWKIRHFLSNRLLCCNIEHSLTLYLPPFCRIVCLVYFRI